VPCILHQFSPVIFYWWPSSFLFILNDISFCLSYAVCTYFSRLDQVSVNQESTVESVQISENRHEWNITECPRDSSCHKDHIKKRLSSQLSSTWRFSTLNLKGFSMQARMAAQRSSETHLQVSLPALTLALWTNYVVSVHLSFFTYG
jgi:hypothetical protein